ncbi:MAG: hypothetical protein IIW48_07825 [Clostridia bacterium]|nr:hypothetical protein [Clostridia bacterium]
MSISFKGFNEQVATFATATELEAGTLVKMSASATVEPCKGGELFIGAVVSSHGNYAAVQTSGYVSLPYSGSAPNLGITTLSAADSETVTSDANGRTVTVIELDETNKTAGILL